MKQKIDISNFEANLAKAANMTLPNQLLIEGKFQNAADGSSFEVRSPHNGAVIAEMPSGKTADIDKAVQSARTAFEDGRWRKLKPRKRMEVLYKLADLMEANAAELAFLESIDTGKPIRYSTTIDIHLAVDPLRFAAEATDKLYGQVANTPHHAIGMISREPLGVIGAITPWNYPMMLACWKYAPALALGNSVVLKPAEQTSFTALRIAELALEAGIPDGVFNVVTGLGEMAGKALALHQEVDCIAFTGSSTVAKLLLQYSGQSNMKRVTAETGGKTPQIIFADAYDLNHAAWQAAFGVFFNTGAMCVAGSRVLVQEGIVEEVLEVIKVAATKLQPGNPFNPKVRLGPVIDQAQGDKIMHYIEVGKKEGANLCLGGNRVLQETGGYYIEPTVFRDVSNQMTIAQEEIFGPVISLIPFKDEADALRIANDSQYGLAAAVWTSDMAKGLRMSKELKAGSVWINNWEGHDQTVPFGGYKLSGIGRKDKSLQAFDKYSNFKTTWIHIDGKGVNS